MGTIVLNIIIQAAYFIGAVFLFGFIISLLNRAFYSSVKQRQFICYATGFIGTPIHELSHALMCLIFGHKIDEIQLFQIDNENGVLGYVRHSYVKTNVYQRIGNYFIGTAPIICGAGAVYLLMRLLAPTAFWEMTECLNKFASLQSDVTFFGWFGGLFVAFGGMLWAVLSAITTGFTWWLFMFLSICIALHINLSGADIKSSLYALPFLIGFLVVINLIVGLIFNKLYAGFCLGMHVAGGYLLGILLFSVLLSCLCLAVPWLIKGIVYLLSLVFRKR